MTSSNLLALLLLSEENSKDVSGKKMEGCEKHTTCNGCRKQHLEVAGEQFAHIQKLEKQSISNKLGPF